jgi:excisionase family DNA binding protein
VSEEVYTVEHVAERLKLHPKTVLRFIREGRLRATRLGKSYRVLRSDLEALTRQGEAAGASPARSDALSVRVTTVVDLDGLSPERAQRLSTLLTSVRMGNAARPDPMNLSIAHDPARDSVKVVMVGSASDTAGMLRLIQGLTEA